MKVSLERRQGKILEMEEEGEGDEGEVIVIPRAEVKIITSPRGRGEEGILQRKRTKEGGLKIGTKRRATEGGGKTLDLETEVEGRIKDRGGIEREALQAAGEVKRAKEIRETALTVLLKQADLGTKEI